MSKPICRDCFAREQLFKRCRNLSVGTVLQGWSCLSGSKPICRHSVAGVQLFKRCQNLSVGTVLQGCSCLSGVKTYLPALCCRGAAVLVVSKPICLHCVAEVQLFKQCRNYLLALCCRGAVVKAVSNPNCQHCVAGVQLFKWCQNLSAGIVLQRCSCLSGVETYLPALCCRGAAV